MTRTARHAATQDSPAARLHFSSTQKFILVIVAMIAGVVIVAGIVGGQAAPAAQLVPAAPVATVAPAETVPASVTDYAAAGLPACRTEDSTDCYWDAQARGNGKGRSFINLDGQLTYLN